MHVSILKALRSAMRTKSISFVLIHGFQNFFVWSIVLKHT